MKKLSIKHITLSGKNSPQAPTNSLTVNNGIYLTVNGGKYLIVNK